MLLEIKEQKNGTIILTAPDGTIYPFKLEPKKKDAILKEIGEVVLTVLSDPEQPEATVSGGHVTQGGRPVQAQENVEGALRGFMDACLPGSSRLLDGLQNISSDPEEAAS